LIGTAPTAMCPLHGGLLASAPALTTPAPAPAMPAALPSPAAPAAVPSPSSNSVLGSVGRFLGGLFGH
jgi:hypothetical protein